MAKSSPMLPHETAELFLTDGGLETSLIFLDGFELPSFAAFHLLKDAAGYQALRNYYSRYLAIAVEFKTGFILESPTWRANPDWIAKTGYPDSALAEINQKSIQLMLELKSEFASRIKNILISGCLGPRGDGYKPELLMTAAEAQDYHDQQVRVLAETPADMVSAMTMNYVEEAIGIANAGAEVQLPVVISFTLETNGRLATGMAPGEAIEKTDAQAKQVPIYYMINCAHPTHFIQEMEKDNGQTWTKRIRGIRANASCKSHAELDESTELDSGNPSKLARENQQLKTLFPHLNIFGGCCGTDDRHIRQTAGALTFVSV